MARDIMDDPEYREIAQGFSDSASGYIQLFAEKYFGKKLEYLSKDENDEIDAFGLYGCIDWLEDNGHLDTKDLTQEQKG